MCNFCKFQDINMFLFLKHGSLAKNRYFLFNKYLGLLKKIDIFYF